MLLESIANYLRVEADPCMWTSDPMRGGQRFFFPHPFVFFLVPHSFPIHYEIAQLILFFFPQKNVMAKLNYLSCSVYQKRIALEFLSLLFRYPLVKK